MRYVKKIIKNKLISLGYNTKPSFLIIGAQKAGTTILYSYLKNHRDIIEPGWKEIHFFDDDSNYSKGLEWYFYHFYLPYKFKNNQITFEATPDYLFYQKCSQRIYKYFPDIKLIIVLRDPVERAYSAWNMHHYNFKESKKYAHLYDNRQFSEAVIEEINNPRPKELDKFSYLKRGEYHEQIINYLTLFPKENILIIDSHDLKEFTQETLDIVTSFLAKTSFKVSAIERDKNFWENKGNYRSNMDEDVRILLEDYFKIPDELLKDLLKKNFSWF